MQFRILDAAFPNSPSMLEVYCMTKWLNPNRNLKQLLCRHRWHALDDEPSGETYTTHKDGRKIINNFMVERRQCEKCYIVQESTEYHFQDNIDAQPIFRASILTTSSDSCVLETVIIDGCHPREFQMWPVPAYPEPTNVSLVEMAHYGAEPERGLLRITFENAGSEFLRWLIDKKIERRIYTSGAYTPGKDYKAVSVLRIVELVDWKMMAEPSPHNPGNIMKTSATFLYAELTKNNAIQNT